MMMMMIMLLFFYFTKLWSVVHNHLKMIYVTSAETKMPE